MSQPAWLGYSIGRWDGNWSVVDTRGFKHRSWLDDSGRRDAQALTRRGTVQPPRCRYLEVQVTIEDPQASTRPRSFPLQFEFLADTEMIEDVCDNRKDAVHTVGNLAAQPPLAPNSSV